ncbi:beta-lactamase transpeptidase [Fusarium pseudocircinatum]|uniref:Beta-lactamase transpeptidase n=1 Tax=Fusarium pseudocircinatum TaxID=56676 RepID=A0A8H5KPD4_9HYPO|nr:beta-lactamase transpeptidase [Fusarium pseudocircinatum]
MDADADLAEAVRSRIEALCPILDQIQESTRSASISIGVLHHGEVIFTRSRGFCDVESQAPADSEKNYLLCSLTKAFTAACCGILVDEGKLEWTKPLQSYVQFRSVVDPVIGERATIQDALSHNTGLAHMDLTWLGVECDYILGKEDLLEIVSHLPPVHDLRSGFHYNNYMYAVAGLVIEQQSGRPCYLDAIHHEPSVLKEIPIIVSHKSNITTYAIGENTYSLAFARAMIPSTELKMLFLNGPQREHVIGRTSRPRLILYHNGVVLGNSHGLGDGPDWSAQAIAQAMFDLQPPIDFAEVSKQRAKTEYERYARVAADFEYLGNEERSKDRFNVNLEDYVGKYVNSGLKMTLDIRYDTAKSLIMVVNNVSSQCHRLSHFAGDKFGFLPSSRHEFVAREFIDWFT